MRSAMSHFGLRALLFCLEGASAEYQLGWNHAPVQKDNDAVSKNFEDVDVELLSPAFLDPETIPDGFANGTAGPTSDATLGRRSGRQLDLPSWLTSVDFFIRNLTLHNSWMNYQVVPFLSEEGRTFPHVFLSTSKDASAANSSDKLRVYIQGAIHGNEPAGDQGILALLGKLDANQTWASHLLERLDILVLPRYNPDGVAYFQRELATNIDPNREHTKLVRQQSRDIKRFVSRFNAHVVIDMHEYTASNVFGGVYRHSSDVLIGSGRNLNTHAAIRNLTEDLFSAGAAERLEAAGFRVNPYVTGPVNETVGSPIVFEEAVTSPTSGRNAYGLTQAVAILCEARGIRLADQHFQRRTASSLTMLEALLDIARDNVHDVLATLQDSIDDFIHSNADIVLSDYQESTNRTFALVDTRNGSIVDVPIEFLSSSPATANQTRSRPEAYLIPRNRADIADRLALQGVDIETLAYAYAGTVEAFNVTSSHFEAEPYEALIRNRVTVAASDKVVHLPAGSFRVSTRQKNAALAFVALEPEVAESFVTFGLIHVEAGDEYPVFREVASSRT
ncbi:carboxypeptidase [Verticillium dahliae]